jgi:Mrp family chromosome partitioning ATPase
MWLKNKKGKNIEENQELVLPSQEGGVWAAFPVSVVNPVRRFISRIGRTESIPPRLSFVAALRQEGVTYISWLFATTLAYDLETSVCIVDLNWSWASGFAGQLPVSGGLAGVLAGGTTLEGAIVRTGKSNLAVLPGGELPENERSHFARSTILKETLKELNTRYDHLVLDIPAVLASTDAIPLASLGTACCLVIHQGVTSINDVKIALRDLDHIPNLGVVMNRFQLATPRIIHRFINPYS